MHCSCANICQNRPKILAELDLVGFARNGQMPDLLGAGAKCGTSHLLQARCQSCGPTNSCKALKEELNI